MSCLNDQTFHEILKVLQDDLFPKYTTELMEETNMLYREVIKQGVSHDEAVRYSLNGASILAFNQAVKLSLLITCLGNSTNDHQDVINFLKNNVKMHDESDIRSMLTVVKGGKE